MSVWTSVGKGVRYREHTTRKHGKRPDRYWSIQYWLNGKAVNEAVGWWSQGASQGQCEDLLAALRTNQRSGHGPQTLKEMREVERQRREAKAAELELARHENSTLGGYWEHEYLPYLRASKSVESICTERSAMKCWLAPLKNKPLKEISSSDMERLVVAPMVEAGKSPRTIKIALDTMCVIWNTAKRAGIVQGDNPVTNAKRPRQDNQRVRFLTRAEAADLLEALKIRSIDAHDLALLSLFSGLRMGECLDLTWPDIDFEEGTIFVKDTKTFRNRHAYIVSELEEMLKRRRESRRSPLIFHHELPRSRYPRFRQVFVEAVDELGLNDGISDRRQKLVAHSLRHTFASWLVQAGTPLYTVSQLMGHTNIKMTERYSHLAPDNKRMAARVLEGALSDSKGKS
jgi:integrase